MTNLIRVLELNNAVPRRDDVRQAIEASQDQYVPQQEALMKPQLLYAAEWVDTHLPQDETAMLMGWAASGHRLLGAPILGMFVLTDRRLLFVRKADSDENQSYERKLISQAKTKGFPVANKLKFDYNGEEHHLERLNVSNAKRVAEALSA